MNITKGFTLLLLLFTAISSCLAQESSQSPLLDTSAFFTPEDLRQTVDPNSAVDLKLESNANIQITESGIYRAYGNLQNSSIIIEADKQDTVRLLFDNLNITNQNSPAVYVKSAGTVIITTMSGSSSLNVTGEYEPDGTTKLDAVLFSRSDLVLNGTGTLSVVSAEANGITSKDTLKITGGIWKISARKDGLEANDGILMYDGNVSVESGKDALHCENDEDPLLGYIYISNGSLDLSAADDAIQGNSAVQIDGGTIHIPTSKEGIESTRVQINGGSIDIYATDDGINAAEKTSNAMFIEVNGGNITINMAQGDTDAFDSNGDLFIRGGTINIQAHSPFDADGKTEMTGGTVRVNGIRVTEITTQRFGSRRH